jgi:hypothetical protein
MVYVDRSARRDRLTMMLNASVLPRLIKQRMPERTAVRQTELKLISLA